MPEEKQRGEDNVVFIGSKPFMNYVTSVVMQFTSKKKKEVTQELVFDNNFLFWNQKTLWDKSLPQIYNTSLDN